MVVPILSVYVDLKIFFSLCQQPKKLLFYIASSSFFSVNNYLVFLRLFAWYRDVVSTSFTGLPMLLRPNGAHRDLHYSVVSPLFRSTSFDLHYSVVSPLFRSTSFQPDNRDFTHHFHLYCCRGFWP